ncbi:MULTISPECIES: hypothetical protein [Nostoc]|uniref:Uncharacterized protein n=1 Tax=Nostoc paludosum FACHB-159 TaxID=2692908 RepID=A0ABR8KMI9_9NOSO|nr:MULTISPECIES: hypothetical protein [Nostoc]MBD2683591.1 hypothetical protein [Nostoc sp. FACHB-857]MBD2739919.1 hypothetical protein [Nostoc paludosum FACHB-159]
MTHTPNTRLDRIEAILDRVAVQQQINTQAIAQLTSVQWRKLLEYEAEYWELVAA